MAGTTPFFLSGANAKILLNNKTVAFATDLSYRIVVKHASPRVLGRYEVEVHEPLSYDVTGSFTIIRYARGLQGYLKSLGYAVPNDVINDGSGIGSYGSGSFGATVGSALGLPSADGQFDGKPNESFVPARMFQSKMFNIEVRQKVPGPAGGKTSFGTGLLEGILGGTTAPDNETTIALLRDCRIEEADFRLNKRGFATQTFQFKARYADDDTYIAAKSGVGQELS